MTDQPATVVPVVGQEWIESERGWGQRPAGRTIHRNDADRIEFIADYWLTMPDEVPSEYSRPEGSPFVVEVTPEVYAKLVASKNGIWAR